MASVPSPAHVTAWRTCSRADCDKPKPVCRVCCKMEPSACVEHAEENWEEHDGFFYHADLQRDDRFFKVEACVARRVCTKCHIWPTAPETCARYTEFVRKHKSFRPVCSKKAENPERWCGMCLGWGMFTGHWQCESCESEKKADSYCKNCDKPCMSRYDCSNCHKSFCDSCSKSTTTRVGGGSAVATAGLIIAMFCEKCSVDKS